MPTLPPLIVVVEDDAATLKALGRVLRALGFEPAEYRSAEDFLASPPSRLPLCLVVDVSLGGMSGLDLKRRLRALDSKLPVIAMTAFDDVRIRAEAQHAGCVGCLEKQSDISVLLDLIRTL
jgi:FixJ family two-component response regulator